MKRKYSYPTDEEFKKAFDDLFYSKVEDKERRVKLYIYGKAGYDLFNKALIEEAKRQDIKFKK